MFISYNKSAENIALVMVHMGLFTIIRFFCPCTFQKCMGFHQIMFIFYFASVTNLDWKIPGFRICHCSCCCIWCSVYSDRIILTTVSMCTSQNRMTFPH